MGVKRFWTLAERGVPLVLFSFLSGFGCGRLDGQLRLSLHQSSANDFMKSEVISNGPGIADGQSELLVVIQLLNSDSTPVKDYRPTYEIIAGTGVTASECTKSNINGVATCVLKSSHSGTKRLAVTNIKITLEKDVVFTDPPIGKSLFEIVASNGKKTSGSYQLNGTIGRQDSGSIRTQGAYQLFGGVQGEAFSR